MNPTASEAGPRAAVLLILLLCLLAVTAGPASATPSDPPTPREDTVEPLTDGIVLTLSDIRPAVLRPGEDLVVRGTVRNGTAQELVEPELRLHAQQSTPISRSLLERWLDPTSRSATLLLATERLTDPLATGAEATFSLAVPAEAVPFGRSYTSWGPRGLELTVHDAAAAPVDPASVRSFLVWYPDLEVETMPLTVLAAATATAPERVAAGESGVSLADVAAERLVPLLAALDHPAVDVAVDPSLLVDVPDVVDLAAPPAPGGSEEQAEPDPATAGAAGLRAAVADLAGRRDVHALLWADADTAALAHAGRTDLLPDAAAARRAALADSGIPASTALAWPAGETLDTSTLDALVATGSEAVVVPGTGLTVANPLTYTPSARVDLELPDGTVPAGIVDKRLSALLAGTLVPISAEDAPAALDPLTARQYLLAETAVITRERPADRRDLLLTVPRDFAGDPQLLGTQLTALAQAPWLDRVGLAEMFTHAAPDLARETLPERVVEDGEVDAATLGRATRVLDSTVTFAGVLEEPAELVEGVRASLRAVTSAAWRELPAARTALLETTEDAAIARRGLVAAQPGSTLNLINETAHIPVSVTNEMGRTAHVRVQLAPRDARLVTDEDVELAIPPKQSTTAQVPVHAVGSGDVVVDVVLAAPDGTPIDEPTEIRVRVRADWETVGTAVVAGILVLMLVIGLVRTVRRAHRRRVTGGQP